MNGVPEFYTMEAKQTSSGVWYCSNLSITTDDMMSTLEMTSDAIGRATAIIAKHNNPDYSKMQEKK